MDTETAVQHRIQRWLEFYNPASPRRFLYIIRCAELIPPNRPWPNPENKAARIEYAWQQYQGQLEAMQTYEDDLTPYLYPYTGTEIFAEAFGCPVHRPADNMPFALPLVHSAAEAARLTVPDYGSTPLAMLFEIADELRRRAGDAALMRLVDMQSPLDVVALIWDKETFYPALIETPEVVLELAAKVKTLQIAFLDAWFARYGRPYVAHFPDYYMPTGITLSEDEVGAVSPRMMERYFLPELNELSDHFGGIAVHCCANARHQWPYFARLRGLKLLNLVQPLPEIDAAHRYFETITPQMHGWENKWPLEKGPAQFPPQARIVLQASAATRAEAIQTANMLLRLYRG